MSGSTITAAIDSETRPPGAYKDIEGVMRAQREPVRIVRRLRPLFSFQAR